MSASASTSPKADLVLVDSNITSATTISPTVQTPRNAKPKSKRASRACLVCRRRKVRCNVIEDWPCSNCRWGDNVCILPRRRNRKVWQGPEDFCETIVPLGPIRSNKPSTILIENSSIRATRSWKGPPLPPFIAPPQVEASDEDLKYLTGKGAFHIPESGLRNTLLRAFFDYTYPTLPILDLDAFLDLVTTCDQKSADSHDQDGMSLVLFQALLACGSCNADLDSLKVSGFRTREEARVTMLGRARILHDSDYEKDPITLVQVSLLLSICSGFKAENRNARYWADAAISHSLHNQLHLSSTMIELSQTRKGLLRRLWWSCYLIDQLLCLASDCAPRIANSSHDLPLLSEKDFNVQPPKRTAYSKTADRICQYSSNPQQRKELVSLCCARLTLCTLLKQAFGACHMLDMSAAATDRNRDKALQKHQEIMFSSCIRDLLRWQRSLPVSLQVQPGADDYKTGPALSVAIGCASMHRTSYKAAYFLFSTRLRCLQAQENYLWTVEQETCKIFMENASLRTRDISCQLRNLEGTSWLLGAEDDDLDMEVQAMGFSSSESHGEYDYLSALPPGMQQHELRTLTPTPPDMQPDTPKSTSTDQNDHVEAFDSCANQEHALFQDEANWLDWVLETGQASPTYALD